MKPSAKLFVIVAVLTVADWGVAIADAAPITWHWTGIVTGHTNAGGGARLDTVVPLGTPVDVTVSLDPDAPALNPANCLHGMASASMQVLGRTYTNTGYVWEDAMGFGPGMCAPSLDNVEIVAPSWGSGGPALPDGWVTFHSFSYLPGLWWAGDLTNLQPASIGTQFPLFYLPGESVPQRFTATFQAVPDVGQTPVPEPASMTLFGLGLAAAGAKRWRARRGSAR